MLTWGSPMILNDTPKAETWTASWRSRWIWLSLRVTVLIKPIANQSLSMNFWCHKVAIKAFDGQKSIHAIRDHRVISHITISGFRCGDIRVCNTVLPQPNWNQLQYYWSPLQVSWMQRFNKLRHHVEISMVSTCNVGDDSRARLSQINFAFLSNIHTSRQSNLIEAIISYALHVCLFTVEFILVSHAYTIHEKMHPFLSCRSIQFDWLSYRLP